MIGSTRDWANSVSRQVIAAVAGPVSPHRRVTVCLNESWIQISR